MYDICNEEPLRRYPTAGSRNSVAIIVGSVLGVNSVGRANDRRSSHISSSTQFVFPSDSNVALWHGAGCIAVLRMCRWELQCWNGKRSLAGALLFEALIGQSRDVIMLQLSTEY